MEIIRERLEEILKQKGLSIRDLGTLTGINYSTIARYIRGERSPKFEQVQALAKALGVSPEWLTGEDKTDPDDTEMIRKVADAMKGLDERQMVLLLAFIKSIKGEEE